MSGVGVCVGERERDVRDLPMGGGTSAVQCSAVEECTVRMVTTTCQLRQLCQLCQLCQWTGNHLPVGTYY